MAGRHGLRSPPSAGMIRFMRMSGLHVLLFALPASSAYMEVHGVRMYYEIHGDGRPVVLLHGGLATIRLSFEKQIPVLAQNHGGCTRTSLHL
jgi:hypothetical protein